MSDNGKIRAIVATDCGSTTTKAILIKLVDGEYRLIVRGEAPTTVEAPFEDVTRGVLNAVREVEELSDHEVLAGEDVIHPNEGDKGVDLYLSTSSAGGGLQMMVAGVVSSMTAESAERAALGAGSIVMDVLASNDGRLPHEQIERIRHLRPDMILLSGGIDGGTITHVVELAQVIAAADPKPRLGTGYQLPVIYAGNIDAREEVGRLLGEKTALYQVENLRPVLEKENLGPARDKIHDLFMEHVMAQAPGYNKLMGWTDAPIMPTPGAVGSIIETIAKQQDIEVVGVDIGGATTDVFSVFKDTFNRTVSANLGMSYSVSNVLAEAGIENVMRWVPFGLPELEVRNRIKNKMIRPTTVPQALEDLKLEQAIAREALRLAFEQHKSFAVGLKGVQQERTISDAFTQSSSGATLVNLMDLDLLVGSGGVLSHAPRRQQAALMLTDAFLPEGVTRLAVDSIFMMPQLGVLAEVHEKAATEVFEKDCLIHLGTIVAPVGTAQEGKPCLTVEGTLPDGTSLNEEIPFGEMRVYPMTVDDEIRIKMTPARSFDVGAGPGKPHEATVSGGVVGLMIDTRGRPFNLPTDESKRVEKLDRWAQAFDAYPE
ncbi:MAG: methylaspartate mutase [Candidatus Eisenbacteria bacterium]|nr:methylaspartate mutase [Candidatus Eisenbacteria bacterium]